MAFASQRPPQDAQSTRVENVCGNPFAMGLDGAFGLEENARTFLQAAGPSRDLEAVGATLESPNEIAVVE